MSDNAMRRVSEVMEPALPTMDADAEFEAVNKRLVSGSPAVVIRRDGEPAGIITRFDVVHYLIGFNN